MEHRAIAQRTPFVATMVQKNATHAETVGNLKPQTRKEMIMKIKKCNDCGSRAELYMNSNGLLRVACAASDANYHGDEGVSDEWCDKEGPLCDIEIEAVKAWNNIN